MVADKEELVTILVCYPKGIRKLALYSLFTKFLTGTQLFSYVWTFHRDIFYSLKLLLKCWRANRYCMKQYLSVVETELVAVNQRCWPASNSGSALASLTSASVHHQAFPELCPPLHLTLHFQVTLLLGFWLTSPTLARHRMAPELK